MPPVGTILGKLQSIMLSKKKYLLHKDVLTGK